MTPPRTRTRAALSYAAVGLALVLAVAWMSRLGPAPAGGAIAPPQPGALVAGRAADPAAPLPSTAHEDEHESFRAQASAARGQSGRAALAARARIAGRVLDDLDGPVAGVRVRLAPTDGEEEAETDAQGRFAFADLKRGHVRLDVVSRSLPESLCAVPSQGDASGSSRSVRIDDEATFEVELRVARAGALVGRVVRPDGIGIGGSLVSLEGPGEVRRHATCDAAGAWECAGLAPGRWSLSVDFQKAPERDLFATPPKIEVDLAPGQRAVAPDLVADAWSCVVTGRALALDGSPWTGQMVWCVPGSHSERMMGVNCDEQGRFCLGPLPSGEFVLAFGSLRFPNPGKDIEDVLPTERASFSTVQAPLVDGRRALDLGDLRLSLPRQVTLSGSIRLDLEQVRSKRWRSAKVLLETFDPLRNEWVLTRGPGELDFPDSEDEGRVRRPELGWAPYSLTFDADGPPPRLRVTASSDLGDVWTREFTPQVESGSSLVHFDLLLP